VSTPDVNTPTSTVGTPASGADKSDLNKLLIVVTADSERYVTVDITGANNAAFIRECIFSKVRVVPAAVCIVCSSHAVENMPGRGARSLLHLQN
jgi:hypothetical protein